MTLDSHGKTILVVDDNPLNIKLAVSVLEAEGFSVASAASAEEALVAIETRMPGRRFNATGCYMKVVVVEDNPVDTRLLCAVMESAGHNVTTCDSAVNALEEIRLRRPDVVLVDLNLPGIGGLELVRAIRAHEEMSTVPVLAMTAYPHCYTNRQAVDAGCSEWVVKPLDTRSLIPKLLELCRSRVRES